MRPVNYSETVFTTPVDRCRRFTERLLKWIPANTPVRVLDIGCGTGDQIFDLCRALPQATFIGVDISRPNIDLARSTCDKLKLQGRASFAATDYLQFGSSAFDHIVSNGTLHLIPGLTADLFRKIARDLVAGGLFINVMPHDCGYNRILSATRRVFRSCRSSITDRLIFQVGKLLHGTQLSDEQLWERVTYMYVLPERLGGRELDDLLAVRCGLELVEASEEVHASVAQLKHRCSVYRKFGTVS